MNRLLFIVPMILILPGCVAWEIRDEVRTTNQHLCEVGPALLHTLHGIEETNQQIAQTNAQLAEVQTSLAITQSQLETVYAMLGRTNPQLNDLQGGLDRMKILNDVHKTLTEVNSTLGPLNKAMGTLGGAMSLVGLGDGSKDLLVDEDTAAQSAAPSADAKAAGEQAVAEPSSASAAAKRTDPILGTWVQVYPPPVPPRTHGQIVVVTADGKFLMAEDGKPPISGHWTRQRRSLTYTYDAPPSDGSSATETVELLTLNARTLTVRRGDSIRVHARP